MGMLEDSIRRDGYLSPMTVAADGEAIDGSARLEAVADVLGTDPIVVRSDGTRPVIHVREDIPTADDPRAVRLALAANRVGNVNLNWHPDVLAELRDEGATRGIFEDWELDAIFDAVEPERESNAGNSIEVEPSDELREKWQTAPGQLWEAPSRTSRGASHRLLCGDSGSAGDVVRLLDGERPPSLVFDPPWDVDAVTPPGEYESVLAFCDGRRAADVIARYGTPAWVFAWDCVTSWYTGAHRPLARMKLCLWYGDLESFDLDGAHYGDAGEAHTATNTRGSYLYTPDPRGKHLSDVFKLPITEAHADGLHKHEKPADWMRLLLGDCTRGAVYDPFLGSGVTTLAAEQLGRQSFGCELDPSALAASLERMERAGLRPGRVA